MSVRFSGREQTKGVDTLIEDIANTLTNVVLFTQQTFVGAI